MTAENHVVARRPRHSGRECLFDAGLSPRVASVGIADAFIELGASATLMARSGLTSGGIVGERRGPLLLRMI